MLAKILATRYGFHCTVLFAINSKDDTIDPDTQTNRAHLWLRTESRWSGRCDDSISSRVRYNPCYAARLPGSANCASQVGSKIVRCA